MTHSTLTTRWSALALTAGAAAALVIGGAALPASAAPAAPVEILLSGDGVHFASTLTGQLFAGSSQLIPGGSVTSTFWVKNPTSADAALRISATGVTASSPAYAEVVTLSTWNSGTGVTQQNTLSTLAGCDILVPSQQVEAGKTVKVTVALALDSAVSGTTGQGEDASVGVRVAMRDAAVGAFPESACGDGGVILPPVTPEPEPTDKPTPEPTDKPTPEPTDKPTTPTTPPATSTATPAPSTVAGKKNLASTGADANAPLLLGGALLLGGGLFLASRRRSRATDKA